MPTTLQVPVQEHVSESGWVQPAVIVEYSALEYVVAEHEMKTTSLQNFLITELIELTTL